MRWIVAFCCVTASLPALMVGAVLRADNKTTGEEVGAVDMPAPQTGSPMTYLVDGRQYLTVAISGAGYSGALLTYRLNR